MEKRNSTLVAITVMLVIAFGITLTGWIKARNELIDYRTGNQVAEQATDLSICDNISSTSDERRCTEKLVELSKKLSEYEEVIKRIQVTR